MNQAIRIGAASLAAFLLVLIARFPAHWAAPALPESVSCDVITGSIWTGTCYGLTVRSGQGRPLRLGTLGWSLRPTRLLLGRLSARIELTRASGTVQGMIERELGGALVGRAIQASLPLDPTLFTQLPPNLQGSVRADLAHVRIDDGVVRDLQGRIEVLDLEQRGSQAMPLGSYTLMFPGASDGEPVGQLRDREGPLSVEGTLRLTAEPGYVIEGKVAPRPGAPTGLTQQLQFLGRPDSEGRRSFSLAGTF